MIRVNLLPPEFRKAEATPVKQFLSTIGAVLIAAASVVGWLVVHEQLKAEQTLLTNRTEEVVAQKPKLDTLAALEAQAKDYKGRYDKIEEVAQGRLVLSQKLDEFWEVISSPRAARYDVWLRNLVMQVQPGGRTSGGIVRFSAYSAGPQMARFVDFHEDLQQSEFYKDCESIDPPSGAKANLSTDREPNEGWEFSWAVNFKPLKDLYKDRAAAKEGGGEGPKK